MSDASSMPRAERGIPKFPTNDSRAKDSLPWLATGRHFYEVGQIAGDSTCVETTMTGRHFYEVGQIGGGGAPSSEKISNSQSKRGREIMEAKETGFGGSLLVPSVKELVKESPTKVPPRYIRPDQDPPISSSFLSSLPQVPIIDMELLLSENTTDSELEKLDLACRDWGFFQLINHKVSCSLIEKVKKEIQEFLELPMEDKKKYWQKPGDLEGFGQAFVVSEEQKLDWGDMFYMVTLPSHLRKPHLFPNLPLPFRDTLEEYSKEVKNAALETLLFIAKALNMKDEEIKKLFHDGIQMMRMNYYPPCPEPEQVIGLTPHSDAGGITFLLQLNQVEGLQIKKNGIWIPVIPLSNAFIVNIGDILEIVTNGAYKSIQHRAVATFLSPNLDGHVSPAPSVVASERPPKFKRVTVVDYIKNVFSRELNGKSNIEQYYI
ncbi:hypothetical protein L2E82_26763 [Cichorium intybus]|uniref:Uncharacterized protein n=1 Tax=Cichorium intybus TaxID=13427 RepID=A0ACB9CRB8_CICIN|nr:hypothetical protein L2E82_26763 [Cichorium intybus]